MTNNILIFDFDGTIADTHHFICHISNTMCEDFNYKPIDFNNLPYMKTLSAKEVIKYLEVPILKVPAIVSRAKKEFQKGINDLMPFDHLKEVLDELSNKVATIGILSSNNNENVTQFLDNHNMSIFDFIQTTSKVWSKNVTLKKLISHYKLDKERIIYIGDETRDIDAAKRLGLRCAAVTWGYNTKEVLAKCKPDFLIDKPHDLLKLSNL